jgi:hypothetical protein
MGYKTVINTLLHLKKSQGLDISKLEVGKEFRFEKDGERVFPLHVAVPLVTDEWVYVGLARIEEVTAGHGKTVGTYRVIDVFDEDTRKVFSQHFGRQE